MEANKIKIDPERFKIQMLDPATLTPNPENFRLHPESQRNVLRVSLGDEGWIDPVIWNKRTGNLLDGHARVEEAICQGVEAVPVIVLDVDILMERKILLRHDRIGAMAEADAELLKNLIDTIVSEGVDITDTGWDKIDPCAPVPFDLSPDREQNDIPRESTPYLAFGDKKIPITSDELNGLNEQAQEYFDTNGVFFGFASWLLEGVGK